MPDTPRNWTTIFFTWFFILILAGICALNLWLLLIFRKLDFTPQTYKSHSHTIVEALLWTLATVPGVLALVLIALLVWKGSINAYQLPLIATVIALLIYSGFQLTIAYFWKNLQVVNMTSEAYKQFSDAVLFSGYLTLPVVLIIVGFWWYVSESGPVGKLQSMKNQYKNTNCDNYKGKQNLSVPEIKQEFGEKADANEVHKTAELCDTLYKDIEDLKRDLQEKYGIIEKQSTGEEGAIELQETKLFRKK